MAEKQANNFVYESSRHKILMEEYSKLSTDNEYIDWGKKAQTIAAYMNNALLKVNTAITLEKSRLEKESDRKKQSGIKMGLMQYEGFSQILRTQLDKLIKIMDALPTGSVKPILNEIDPSKIPTPDSPYAKVFVGNSGEVTLDGKITSIEVLKNTFMNLAQRKGVVLYSRETPDAEPPSIARTVINLVVENRLTIRMCKNMDFSDAVDSNGKLRINN
jgi:hypothetical protein